MAASEPPAEILSAAKELSKNSLAQFDTSQRRAVSTRAFALAQHDSHYYISESAAPPLPTDNCPLATAPPDSQQPPTPQRRPNRSSRRPPTPPLTDHPPLTTPRPALSLMFQREVRRHLARLNFPASPESDLAT